MNLNAVKDAIYRSVLAVVPDLTFYPEVVSDPADFPYLCFVELTSDNLQARPDNETHVIPDLSSTTGRVKAFSVVANMRTVMRLELRDNLGEGLQEQAAFGAIRDMQNRVALWAVQTQYVAVKGPETVITGADLWFKHFRSGFDKSSGIYLQGYEITAEWRMVDPEPVIAYPADQIELELGITHDALISLPPPTGGPNPIISVQLNRTIE